MTYSSHKARGACPSSGKSDSFREGGKFSDDHNRVLREIAEGRRAAINCGRACTKRKAAEKRRQNERSTVPRNLETRLVAIQKERSAKAEH